MPLGPKIILRKDAAGKFQTHVDYGGGGVQQSPEGTLAYNTGLIRNDFVGIKIEDFAVYTANGTPIAFANYVAFEKTVGGNTYKIELVRTVGDRPAWFASMNGGVKKQLAATTNWTPNKVPDEFSDFDSLSFKEVVHAEVLDRVDCYRVRLD